MEHLLGEGISADMLNDDCLGRTLDWLYEHDVTTLFAGLALQARRRFGIAAQHLHIDTTSFSVSGDYANQEEGDPVPLAITYGYSRDHRADLKQWMLALATTHDGDLLIFLRPLDGNSSDKEHLSGAVKEVMTQLREQLPEEQEQRIAVFDSGGYSEANMKSYNDANIWWISRVPETSSAAKTALAEVYEGVATALRWVWGICGTHHGVASREGKLGDRANARPGASHTGADGAKGEENPAGVGKTPLASLQAGLCLRNGCAKRMGKGSQRKTILADCYVHLERTGTVSATRPSQTRGHAGSNGLVFGPQLEVDQQEVTVLARKKAAFIVATNILDAQRLSHEQVISTYKEQGGVERGFRFLKYPFFLASSVFVKKPERVIALSFVMVLCLLVYRLAEHLLRRQLVATDQTIANQVNKPTNRPTMRWISNVLRALISCISALVHAGKPRFWDCKVFISRFFAC